MAVRPERGAAIGSGFEFRTGQELKGWDLRLNKLRWPDLELLSAVGICLARRIALRESFSGHGVVGVYR